MDEFERHVEDIYNALDGRIDRETIAKELRGWLFNMKVSAYEAKRSIVSKFGGDVNKLSSAEKKVADLGPDEHRVDIKLRILSVNPKEYEVDGVKKIMYYGIAGDETGTIPFTAWRSDVNLRRGDSIDVRNAYTREWQGKPQLVFGANTRISLLKDYVVQVKSTIRPAKVVELRPNMGLVEVVVKVLESSPREVEVNGEMRRIYEGIVGDETGKIPFTAWDVEVPEGKTLRISGAYVRTFRGMPQLVFDTRAVVEESEVHLDVKEIPVSIESLEGRGGYNVLVEGIIIDVKDKSGLIYRCPECGRLLTSTVCPEHGRVTPKPDLRIKAVLDDGTGGMICIFDRAQTERILGFGLDEAIKKVQENLGNPGVIRDIVEDKLIAQPIRLRGNVISKEKYGLTMLVHDFQFLDVEDVAKEAERMMEELGW